MAVFKRGKVYWYHFTFQGRRIQESSGFQNKTAAQRAEAKRKVDQMTMRYVHPAEEHKREAAGKIENFKAMSAIKLAEKNHGVTTISATVQ
jgi:hypothetical protein